LSSRPRRKTETLEAAREPTNEAEEEGEEKGWRSSRMPSSAFSAASSAALGADEPRRAEGPVGVEEVMLTAHL